MLLETLSAVDPAGGVCEKTLCSSQRPMEATRHTRTRRRERDRALQW